MSVQFNRKTWQDRNVEHPARRRLTPTGENGVYDVTREEGQIVADGDPFAASTMNDVETRVKAGFDKAVGSDQVQNISISTSDLTAGSSPLTTGYMVFVYE